MKSFAAAKSSLVFIKNRCRGSRSHMFFKIGVLKNFTIFTGKHLCWSLFLIKLQAFRLFSCEYCKIVFLQNTSGGCFCKYTVLHYFSKRCCGIYCSFTLHNCFILKSKIFLICFHSLYHSLSFVVQLVVIRSHLLSLVIIHCHSFSFVVTRCTTPFFVLLSLFFLICAFL